MILSEFIAALEAQLAEHGDITVEIEDQYGEQLEIESIAISAGRTYIAINVES